MPLGDCLRGSWELYYIGPVYSDPLALAVLSVFTAVNQAYFLGLLFLISGYFSPGSLACRGPKRFIKDRLIRLGIPLVVCFFVLNPIAVLGGRTTPDWSVLGFFGLLRCSLSSTSGTRSGGLQQAIHGGRTATRLRAIGQSPRSSSSWL